LNKPGLRRDTTQVEMSVWVDAWQMQCCGEQFGVGSRVSWTLIGADAEWVARVLGAGIAVDAAEEHHGGVPDDTPETAGTVTAISAVHCRYAPAADGDRRMLYPAPSSAVLIPVMSADGWAPDRDGLHFVGYLVRIATGAARGDPQEHGTPG